MTSNKTLCCICVKEKPTYSCDGCSKKFCFAHLQEHRQEISKDLDGIANDFEQFKQAVIERKQNPQNSSLLKQIDQWEQQSVEKIQSTALECRKTVMAHTDIFINDIEKKIQQLAEQLTVVREENEFNEIDLDRLKSKLTAMAQEFTAPPKISIRQGAQSFIPKITVISSKKLILNKWNQHATTVAGGNEAGKQLNQLNGHYGIVVDQSKDILVADYYNHRVVEWKWQAKAGTVIAGGNDQGNRLDQLNCPTDVLVDKQNQALIVADRGNKRIMRWFQQGEIEQEILIENIDCWGLAMDRNGCLYASDADKDEVRRWKLGEKESTLVAGGNRRGNGLNQLNHPTRLFVDDDLSVYVSDWGNDRVMKWTEDVKEGVVVVGGNGRGDRLNQVSRPAGVLVDQWGRVYVADYSNHRVVRWCEGDKEGEIVVAGHGQGDESHQLNCPVDLSLDDEGNLYVADCWNHRIQKFELISD